MDVTDRAWLTARGSTKRLPLGTIVFSQSEPIDDVFVIEAGRVKAYYTTPEGQSITFAYWLKGMLMGVPGLSTNFDHMWTAETVVPTSLLCFSRSDLVAVIDRSTVAAKAVIEILEFKTRHLSRLAQLLATASVAERLRIVLLNLCDLYGEAADGGMRIGLPLTHADIADMVGASRQWVTISLGRLERAGLIGVERRRITVYAPNGFPVNALGQASG
jgi:CRP-like cAMP-binding protein